MTEEPRLLRLSVSPALLRLVTECILIQSNENQRLETIDRLAADLLTTEQAISPDEVGHLRDHLTAMPSAGPITVEISVEPAQRRTLAVYRTGLEEALDQPASEADALSCLLFAFLVDHRVRTATAAIASKEAGGPGEGPTPGSRVLPFRR